LPKVAKNIAGASSSAKSIRALLDIALSPVNKLLFLVMNFILREPNSLSGHEKPGEYTRFFPHRSRLFRPKSECFFWQNGRFNRPGTK